MNYKEIQKLKKSELQELLATTLQQKATQERVIASLQCTNQNILIDELYSGIDERNLKIDELYEESNIFRTQNIKLHKRLECLLTEIERLETDNKIHLREKQEARELSQKYSESNNKLRNDIDDLRVSVIDLDYQLAEGSTPKNLYIHEIESIFADSGELHLQADNNKSVVFNCSNLVQDLASINDMVIKSAKKDLKDSIQQIKQLTKDI